MEMQGRLEGPLKCLTSVSLRHFLTGRGSEIKAAGRASPD